MWILVSGVPVAGLILLSSPIRNRRDLPEHPTEPDADTNLNNSR